MNKLIGLILLMLVGCAGPDVKHKYLGVDQESIWTYDSIQEVEERLSYVISNTHKQLIKNHSAIRYYNKYIQVDIDQTYQDEDGQLSDFTQSYRIYKIELNASQLDLYYNIRPEGYQTPKLDPNDINEDELKGCHDLDISTKGTWILQDANQYEEPQAMDQDRAEISLNNQCYDLLMSLDRVKFDEGLEEKIKKRLKTAL